MGLVVRISGASHWGSAFCIDEPGGRVFHTAAHVLRDVGLGAVSAHGQVQLCDERLGSLATFEACVTSYDAACDLATFTCEFPAIPFRRCERPPAGSSVAVRGYLFMPDGDMPDCGVDNVLEGWVDTFVQGDGCHRGFAHLTTFEAELPGMSGSPVSPTDDRGAAFGLLNGAPRKAGGPPFNFTFI